MAQPARLLEQLEKVRRDHHTITVEQATLGRTLDRRAVRRHRTRLSTGLHVAAQGAGGRVP